MPNDSSSLIGEYGGTYTSTMIHKTDQFGYFHVPVTIKDIFGRKSRMEIKRMSPLEYKKWKKDNA